jgi:hypothetical protein
MERMRDEYLGKECTDNVGVSTVEKKEVRAVRNFCVCPTFLSIGGHIWSNGSTHKLFVDERRTST